MFDIAWSEMLIVLVLIIIVVGPKDLPRLLRTAGQWMRRAQSMAREFRSSMSDMAHQADLDDLRRGIDPMAPPPSTPPNPPPPPNKTDAP